MYLCFLASFIRKAVRIAMIKIDVTATMTVANICPETTTTRSPSSPFCNGGEMVKQILHEYSQDKHDNT